VPAEIAKENLLRAGMSVYVRVNTKPGADAAH
jgi:membrane fusion protein, multidrug efflux system